MATDEQHSNGSGGDVVSNEQSPAASEGSASPQPSETVDPKAVAWVEGIRARANRATSEPNQEPRGEEEDVAEAGEDGEAGKDEGEVERDAAEGAVAEEEPKPRRTLQDLHVEHRDRIERQRAIRRAEKAERSLEEVVAVLKGLQAGAPGSAAADDKATAPAVTPPALESAPEEPEPDFDLDPKAWHVWQLSQIESGYKQRERQFQEQLVEQLSPLIEGGKAQQQAAEQAAAAAAMQERSAAFAGEVSRLVSEYTETGEGHGYRERASSYAKFFVDDLVARGASEEEAKMAFQMEATELLVQGENAGYHPVAYYDAYIIHKARLAEGLPTAFKPAAPAAATQTPPAQPAKSGAQQRKAESDLAAAAAAANLPEARAGRDRDAVSAGPQAVDIGAMVKRGGITGDAIKRVAAAQDRPLMQVIKEALRAASAAP